MDWANLQNMRHVCGSDPDGKLYLLMEYTAPDDVGDPWYTGDFESTWHDALEGYQG